MADLEAVTSSAASGLSAMEDKVKSLGKETKFMTQNIAGSAKVFSKAGFSAEQTVEALDGVTEASAAAGEEITEVTEQLIGVVNGFDLAAEETQRVADVFAQAAVSTKSSMGELAKAMEYIGPVSANMGQSLEETTAQLGILSDASINAGRAGRQLRTAFLDFQKMEAGQFTQPAKEALDRLGFSLQSIQSGKYSFQSLIKALMEAGATAGDMSTIFTKRAATALVILGEKSKELDGLTKSLENAKGAAQEMAETRLDTLIQQFSVLRGSINLLMIEIGSNFTPGLKGMVKSLTSAVNTMTDLVDNTKDLEDVMSPALAKGIRAVAEALKYLGIIVASYGIAAAIGPIASGLSKLAAITTTIATNILKVAAILGKSLTAKIFGVIYVFELFTNVGKTAKGTIVDFAGELETIEGKEKYIAKVNEELKKLEDQDELTESEEATKELYEEQLEFMKEQLKLQKEQTKEAEETETRREKELEQLEDRLENRKNYLEVLKKEDIAPFDTDAISQNLSQIQETKEEIEELEKHIRTLKGVLSGEIGTVETPDASEYKTFYEKYKNQVGIAMKEGLTQGLEATRWEKLEQYITDAIEKGIGYAQPSWMGQAQELSRELAEPAWMGGLPAKVPETVRAGKDISDQFFKIEESTISFEDELERATNIARVFGDEEDVLRKRMSMLKDRVAQLTAQEDKNIESPEVQKLIQRYRELREQLKGFNYGLEQLGIGSVEQIKKLGKSGKLAKDEMISLHDRTQEIIRTQENYINALDALGLDTTKAKQRLYSFKVSLGLVDPKLKELANTLGLTISEMQKSAKNIKSKVGTVVNGIRGIFQAAAVDIPPAIDGLLSAINSGASAIQSFAMGNWLQGIFQIGQAIASIFGGMKRQMEKRVEDLKEQRHDLKEELRNAVEIITKGMETLSDTINSITGLISGPLSSAISGMMDGFINMFRMTTQMNDTQALLRSGMSAIASITKGVISTFTSLIEKSDAYKKFQDKMEPIWNALGNAIANVVLPPLIALAEWIQEFFGIAQDTSEALEEVGVVASWKRNRRRFQAAKPGQIMPGEGGYEVPEWARQIIEPLKNVLTPVFRELKSMPLQQIGQGIWQGIVDLAVKWIPKVWKWIRWGVKWLQNNGERIWNEVKENIISLWNFFKNNIGPAWQTFFSEADKLMDGTTLGDIKDSIDGLAKAITGAETKAETLGNKAAAAGGAGAIGAGAGWALGGPAGALIGGGLGLLGGWIFGGQEGLIAKKPTLAAIAENPAGGSEAVVPLDKLEQMINMEGRNGKGNVYVFLSGRDVTDVVVDEVQFKNRKNNGMSNTASAFTGGY